MDHDHSTIRIGKVVIDTCYYEKYRLLCRLLCSEATTVVVIPKELIEMLCRMLISCLLVSLTRLEVTVCDGRSFPHPIDIWHLFAGESETTLSLAHIIQLLYPGTTIKQVELNSPKYVVKRVDGKLICFPSVRRWFAASVGPCG